jgi:hypothetical protein
MTTTTLSKVILSNVEPRDETLTAAIKTYTVGTLLARDTSTLKLVPYVKGGTTNGNGIINSILTAELVADAAQDYDVSVMIAGRVDKDLLVIDADGDATNVDAAVVDELGKMGIYAQSYAKNTQGF